MLAADRLTITPPEPPVVRRVELPDLQTMAGWLVRRLTERHPEATPSEILAFLRGCLASNECWFVHTAHCCALAQLGRVPLEHQPIASEVFVLAQDGHNEEAEALYPAMASWAAHLDCSRLNVDHHTDVARNMIRSALGTLISKPMVHLKLGRLS